MRRVTRLALAAIASLGGCAASDDPLVWVRADGGTLIGNPRLATQLELDEASCTGVAQRAAVGASIGERMDVALRARQLIDVATGCMAERGYLARPASSLVRAEAIARAPAPPAEAAEADGQAQPMAPPTGRLPMLAMPDVAPPPRLGTVDEDRAFAGPALAAPVAAVRRTALGERS